MNIETDEFPDELSYVQNNLYVISLQDVIEYLFDWYIKILKFHIDFIEYKRQSSVTLTTKAYLMTLYLVPCQLDAIGRIMRCNFELYKTIECSNGWKYVYNQIMKYKRLPLDKYDHIYVHNNLFLPTNIQNNLSFHKVRAKLGYQCCRACGWHNTKIPKIKTISVDSNILNDNHQEWALCVNCSNNSPYFMTITRKEYLTLRERMCYLLHKLSKKDDQNSFQIVMIHHMTPILSRYTMRLKNKIDYKNMYMDLSQIKKHKNQNEINMIPKLWPKNIVNLEKNGLKRLSKHTTSGAIKYYLYDVIHIVNNMHKQNKAQ